VWLDRAGALGREMGVVGLPTTVFLDADGQVVEVAFGELSRARLRASLERLSEAGSEGDDARLDGARRRAGVPMRPAPPPPRRSSPDRLAGG